MDSSPSNSDDILTALRAATGVAHQQLEDAVKIETRVADRASYTRLLQSFLGFYRPLEARLAALDGWERHGFDWSVRRKTPWLEADLQALGIDAAAVNALPDCLALPPVNNHAQGLGCLYVLEGATLGGRQITALLQGSSIPPDARRFFGSYGAQTGTRWREFVATLQREAAHFEPSTKAELVAAARQTFTCLQAWIVEEYPRDEHTG